MLVLQAGAYELFDEELSEFVEVPPYELRLQHSLVSLSKWESIHEKPFLTKDKKTSEEILSYVSCMSIDETPPDLVLRRLTSADFDKINDLITSKKTATWFTDRARPTSSVTVTSELIYYWMTALTIPFECENWHLNRLLTLIRVCNESNDQSKNKMSRSDINARNRALNQERRAKMGTKG